MLLLRRLGPRPAAGVALCFYVWWAMETNLFKFMALRAPDSTAMDARAGEMVRDERSFDATVVGGILALTDPPKSESLVLREARDLVARLGYALDKQESPLRKLDQLLARHRRAFDAVAFEAGLRDALGATPAEFAATKELASLLAQTWDKLYLFFVLKRVEPLNLEGLLRDLRGLNLVKALAADRATASAEVLEAYCGHAVMVPQRLAGFAPAVSGKRTSDKPAADVLQSYDALWQEFGDLHRARQELRTVKWEQKTVSSASMTSNVTPVKKGAPSGKVGVYAQAFQLSAPTKELSRLSESTRRWLTQSRAVEGAVSLAAMSDRMNTDLTALQRKILSIKDPFFFERLPREAEWAGFFSTHADVVLYPGLLLVDAAPLRSDVFSPPLPGVKPLGVGDLKVVKQTFEKYTAGEIAHIENVLQGEYKERKHRQLNRSEDIATIEQETIEESERDTQKTDRFELKKESENAIETDMSVQAGLTVSASYGPVSIGARADFAYSTSSRETNRSSSNFAQEIVSRAVDKIQKKAREERVKKILQETEETNLHGIDNKTGAGNISGIYRFVDKHYTAQIFNYGRRLMFEFVVPEPAAFLRFSRNAPAAPAGDFPPLIPLGTATHRDIQDWNYHEYIQRYRVQGVTPPPPLYTTVTTALASGDIPPDVARGDSNKELNIPAGYVAKYWTGRTQSSGWEAASRDLTIIVGNGNPDGVLNDEDTNVPIGIHMLQIAAYTATVEVHCERTPRHFEEWQIKTYEKIVAAYRAMVAEKENRATAAAPLGVTITGQNPRLNREVEKTELKKNCVTILSNQYYGSFNAMSGTPPEINVPESLAEGQYIQFFEQAFEWEQLTYLFYPYFWGRKGQWPVMMNGSDPDPLFDQFLKAGAARVLVPVHPLYNDAVLYYLTTGRIWSGGESPRIGDPLFLALYEELRDQQDDLERATPEGRPWKVIVPTSLVYLQSDFSLQTTNADLNLSDS